MNEKVKRLKFIRALEKFVKSNISYLKDSNFDYEVFQKRVQANYEKIKDIEAVRLNSSYHQALLRYVNLTLEVLDKKFDTSLQENLLKEANLLDKEKNKTQYKKVKHRNNNFE
ncbi:hypothetical protein ACKGJI_03005 [Sulfurospirillum sp. 1307]|jgi:hypothetical protein